MEKKLKTEPIYKTIGEVAKELNLIDVKTGQLQTHTIRYWESQFKEITPTVKAGGRRYYSGKDLKVLSFIKYLLKERGLTINGVKKILKENKTHSIADELHLGLYKPNLKNTKTIKDKIKNIIKIAKELKKIKNG